MGKPRQRAVDLLGLQHQSGRCGSRASGRTSKESIATGGRPQCHGCNSVPEGAMDDDKDKNAIDRLVDKINDAVENITTTVSDAVQHAMEPDPVKPGEHPVAYMPMALADPMMPPFVVIPRRKKSTSKNAPKESGKKAAKKTVKKSAKKAARKLSAQKKKKATKAWKPTAGRKSVGRKKTAKKVAKKTKAMKSRRK